MSRTSQPPRLVSGLLRGLGYRIPDHRATHWMVLLAADRVDVMERRLGLLARCLPALAAAGVGYLVVKSALRRRTA